MNTKTKCVLLLIGCILVGATIFGLYIYFKGFQGVTGEVKEENVKEVIESSSENSKGLVLDESFKGTIREGDNLNFKMGNLSYHRHVANLNHEQLMVSVSSSQTTYKLAIGISGGLLLLAAAGVFAYKMLKLRTNRNNNTNNTTGRVQYTPNNRNNAVIYTQTCHGGSNASYRFNQTPSMENSGAMVGNQNGQLYSSQQRHSSQQRQLPNPNTITNGKPSEDQFYEILMEPILHELN